MILVLLPLPGITGETQSEINERWKELQAKADWAAAEQLFRDGVDEHPDAEWLRTNLSRALVEQEKYDEAIQVARDSLEKFSGSDRSRSALAIAYIKRGTSLAKGENHEAALLDYRAAYETAPDKDYVILNYAIALSNLSRYDESVDLYRKGLQRHPEYDPLRRNFVWTLVRQVNAIWSGVADEEAANAGASDRAFTLAAEAYKTDPGHRGALRVYGRALLKAGRPLEAIPVLKRGHENFRDSRAFCWPLSRAYRLRVEELMRENPSGNRSRALKVARQIPMALRGEPKCDNSLLFVYDSIYSMLGAFEESIPVLERLARRYPQHSAYLANAGEHVNRYAVWLRTVKKDRAAAQTMRERGNALLRRAMDLYEKNHPDRPRPDAPVEFPLKDDAVFVIAAFDSGGTHSGYGKYCYDLAPADERGAMLRQGASGRENADFYGFGAPVYAVRAGVVDVADDGDPDGVPGVVQYQSDGNFVRIRHADGTFASYVHLKEGSIRVRVGQRVRAGESIGALGNSGMSVSPHLHFCLVSADYVSLDFRFVPLKVRQAPGEEIGEIDEPLQSGWLVRP